LIIALKSGPDQIPEFVTIDEKGDENRVFRPGYMNSGRFSYSKGVIVWDEWVPDLRWSNRNFSVIRMFDLNQKRVSSLGSSHQVFFTGDLRKRQLHCCHRAADRSFISLVVLDRAGEVIHSVPSPQNRFIQHPQWMEQDSALVVTLSDRSGEFLYRYAIEDGDWTMLFHAGYHDISHPVVDKNVIYFGSTFSGIDNIYMYHTGEESLHRVTTAAFGAFEPDMQVGESFCSPTIMPTVTMLFHGHWTV
jgi:hypothetical protein